MAASLTGLLGGAFEWWRFGATDEAASERVEAYVRGEFRGVTAALARQLQHSVPADRGPARALAQAGVAIARRLDDPVTLASCLLAEHDTLWTPGAAARVVDGSVTSPALRGRCSAWGIR